MSQVLDLAGLIVTGAICSFVAIRFGIPPAKPRPRPDRLDGGDRLTK